VERANDGITIIQDVTVRYANPALAKLWGDSVEEIVGRQFTDFIDRDEIPKVVERYQLRTANKNVTPIYETILRRRNGTEIFVEPKCRLDYISGIACKSCYHPGHNRAQTSRDGFAGERREIPTAS